MVHCQVAKQRGVSVEEAPAQVAPVVVRLPVARKRARHFDLRLVRPLEGRFHLALDEVSFVDGLAYAQRTSVAGSTFGGHPTRGLFGVRLFALKYKFLVVKSELY